MGCCLSLLELQFLQSEYTRIPDDTYLQPYNENNISSELPPPKSQKQACEEIGKLSHGNYDELTKKYVLIEDIGKGSFSTVRLGLEIGTNHRVAVKIVNKVKLGKGLNLKNLLSEITILLQCNHENIIKLYNVYDESPNYYLVTEFVSGGELFDCIIRRTYYTEASARKIITQLLTALQYLHLTIGVVHRDIKPENILLTNDDDSGIVKLADFGFAKMISKLAVHEVSLGTPAYVAPEIIRGDPYGAEVDIWSLGVVCYILLCGCPPFQEESSKIFDQIKAGLYDFHEEHWSHVSPSAVDLISKMLTVNQQERWSAQRLLTHPWIQSYREHKETEPSLDICLAHLKRFRARKKLKAVAHLVVVTNRMKKFSSDSSSVQGAEAIRRYQEKTNAAHDHDHDHDHFHDDVANALAHSPPDHEQIDPANHKSRMTSPSDVKETKTVSKLKNDKSIVEGNEDKD